MKDCQGELLQRVRRGLASPQEQNALEAHLGGCESCRMTVDLLGDFDAVGEAEPGDLERVAGMATRAAAARGRSAPGTFRASRRTWQLLVAALVVSGVAAAGMAARYTQKKPSVLEASPRAGKEGLPRATPVAPKAAVVGRAAPEESTPTVSPAPDSKGQEKGSLSLAPTKLSAPSISAQDVYREANDARRAGRTGQAISDYQKLQRQFPGSPEAHASRVSLGGLLLRSGSSTAALAQFDAYLVAGGGQLAAEALFGRGQALRALGRSAEEEQNLNRLVSNYPQSAYATHAQRRLLELR